MTDRYTRIREALAMGPTPGPWKASYQSVLGPLDMAILYAVVPCFFVTDCRYSVSVKEATANAALAAACDSDTIRALMEERDALKAENERLREALEMMVEMVEMNGFGRDYAMDVARAALEQEACRG